MCEQERSAVHIRECLVPGQASSIFLIAQITLLVVTFSCLMTANTELIMHFFQIRYVESDHGKLKKWKKTLNRLPEMLFLHALTFLK